MTKSSLFFLLLVSIVNNSLAQNTIETERTAQQEVIAWISEANVPGIAISVIEDGLVVNTIVEGIDVNGNDISSSTVFDVASLTKSITTLAVIKLIEKENLDLNEPLYHQWIDPDVQGDMRHQKLTFINTLSHQSGFKNWRYMYDDKKLAFEFEPGTQFQYSGEGFEYVRKALENKYNDSFENQVQNLVFEPLGMKNSSLVWSPKMEELNFAGAHDGAGNAYDYVKSDEVNAADNLLTTLEDFTELTLALLQSTYLDQSLFNKMIEPQVEVRSGISFGLGWIVFEDLSNGDYALFNSGSDQGVNSLVVMLPESKRGLVVLTNGDNGRDLCMRAIKHFLGEPGLEMLSRF
ncbi:serine hydrolase domain-containing protein [Portibacter marinus]|uniref:serine hydrolase domain-containing protein n=1 Tax=Portibacter marinus TaxID=2898660 RepID=UPI001F3E535B|nr:serine hydrolase domain-containing protein [Portibacter marinus]